MKEGWIGMVDPFEWKRLVSHPGRDRRDLRLLLTAEDWRRLCLERAQFARDRWKEQYHALYVPKGVEDGVCEYCLSTDDLCLDHVPALKRYSFLSVRKRIAVSPVLVNSCKRCNSLLSAEDLPTVQVRRFYVFKALARKGMPLPFASVEALVEARRAIARRRLGSAG